MKKKPLLILVLFLGIQSNLSHAQTIRSHKDDLFAHGAILEHDSNNDFQRIDYDEMRDVNGRDAVPGKQAKRNRVSLINPSLESSRSIAKVDTYVAGNLEKFQFAVIFIHGGGGNKTLGFDDWSFGGNFNRLKNLVVKSGGVYLSPSANLTAAGAAKIAGVSEYLKSQNPSAKVILICASAGGIICSTLSQGRESNTIDGMVLLGSAVTINPSAEFFRSRKPIVFAHGSRDPVADWRRFYQNFASLQNSGNPARFYLYNNGNHGNPIRMIDWRETLNFLL